MIKSILVLIFLLISICGCSVNNQPNTLMINELERENISKELMDEITYILFLFKQKDLDTLNRKFVNPKIGFYKVFKNENSHKIVFNRLLKIDDISDEVTSYDIKQEMVTFDCSPSNDKYYGWNKEGTFITTDIKPYLSQIMNDENRVVSNKYKENELKLVERIEKTSYEVVVTYNKIFYLTKIDNFYYITLIDEVKTDCGG